MSYADEVAADTPLAWYHLDTDGSDATGNGHTLTLHGPTFQTSPLMPGGGAGSLLFSGTQWAENDGFAPLLSGLHACTFECWAKPLVVQSSWPYIQCLVIVNDNSGNFASVRYGNINSYADAPEVAVSLTSGWRTATATARYAAGSVLHVVAIYDHGAVKLYVNTVLVAETDGSDDPLALGGNLYLGAETDPSGPQGGRMLNGVLDEVAVYDHALSTARIGAHYEAGRDITRLQPTPVNLVFTPSAALAISVVLEPTPVDLVFSPSADLTVNVPMSGKTSIDFFNTADLVLGRTALPAPAVLARGVSHSQIELDWTPSYGFADYEIQGSDDGTTFATVATVGGLSSWVEGSLSYAQTRYYRLRAIDMAGPGPWSSVVSAATVPAPAPGEPPMPDYVVPVIPRPLMKKVVVETEEHYGWTNPS